MKVSDNQFQRGLKLEVKFAIDKPKHHIIGLYPIVSPCENPHEIAPVDC